jgi:hypothetical protein
MVVQLESRVSCLRVKSPEDGIGEPIPVIVRDAKTRGQVVLGSTVPSFFAVTVFDLTRRAFAFASVGREASPKLPRVGCAYGSESIMGGRQGRGGLHVDIHRWKCGVLGERDAMCIGSTAGLSDRGLIEQTFLFGFSCRQ